MKTVLDRIIVSHDRMHKVHHLDMKLRVPVVVSGIEKGCKQKTTYPFTPRKPLINKGHSTPPGSLYSTVTEHPSISTPAHTKSTPSTGHFLVMSVRLTSSNLWLSPYSQHQQELFDIIRTKHEDEGLNFTEISDWMVQNDYKTPRGTTFSQGKCWSIYTKKKRSINRFSRTFEPDIKEVKVDIVNYQPTG